MALESQGQLERYRRVWFADTELQILTRGYERKSEAMTAEVNRLWKLLRLASPDLYLALGGNNPEVELKQNMLQSQGVLALLGEKPNVGEWKNLSDEEFLSAMGGNSKGRHALIQELRKVAANVKPVTPAMALMIQSSAGQIERFKREQRDITKMLDELTKECPEVQRLKEMRGIGTITATTMIAEIIDIRRFVREDNLASYSGFGMKEHSTGESTRMVSTRSFNHRLKDIFMTAARNYVLYNPDYHLAGYYRNLVKAGMHPMEATKRVARALVRVIFRMQEHQNWLGEQRLELAGADRQDILALGVDLPKVWHASSVSFRQGCANRSRARGGLALREPRGLDPNDSPSRSAGRDAAGYGGRCRCTRGGDRDFAGNYDAWATGAGRLRSVRS
jgi:hypothetical protein